jgi:putative NADH-flavin reductase
MAKQETYLVFGATGLTGKHFIAKALADGNKVHVLVRNPAKLEVKDANLEVHTGTISNVTNLDELLSGVDYVVAMLGDAAAQNLENVNEKFVKQLVPAMRRQGVKRFLYQAGAFSKPAGRPLSPLLWLIKNTLAAPATFRGQHRDNAAVMSYLANEAKDIEWMVHRAAINSDGPSRGQLVRSRSRLSVGTFADCADYNYRLLKDPTAIHTCDLSRY